MSTRYVLDIRFAPFIPIILFTHTYLFLGLLTSPLLGMSTIRGQFLSFTFFSVFALQICSLFYEHASFPYNETIKTFLFLP